ncbi:MAG: pyridoxamine 5'-phosphate oxidase [Deltaproteobacteria bacterium]|nr:pyridoxamine 5'-phosphate oxidase [Deltaproteobacteria bacterium]
MTTPDEDPLATFDRWQRGAAGRLLRWALRPLYGESDAAALATASPDGRPSVRMVLVKHAATDGFVFYTNLASRKAKELAANPHAALAFYWPLPPRQVRVEGPVVRLSPEEDERYWRTRPRGSQLGAMASRQSEPIADRQDLLRRLEALRERWSGRQIPCPPYWGGFRIVPERIELWQGRPDRLHDRWCYLREPAGWRIVQLAP